MKTSKINLSALHNEEHFQFHTEFNDLVMRFNPATIGIEDAFKQYQPLLKMETEALLVIRKSATTQQLSDADDERDIVFRGFADAVKSAVNHFDASKREAAKRINLLFDKYGNVARKPYNEETAEISKLIQETQSAYAADIAHLGLGDWIKELNERNQAFDTLIKNRFSEDAARTDLKMKYVRDEIDAQYRIIADRIDALILINGITAYDAFVQELNARVTKYSNSIAQRKGRAAKPEQENEQVKQV